MRRAALLLCVATGALATGVLATAGAPASAHGGDVPDATAYRTAVSAVTPARAGLTVRTVDAGARLELTNRTGRSVEVLGYAGEPYLEIRPDGVFGNVNSPATYLNETFAGDTPLPANADPTAPPQWRRISTEPVVRWHDQRTHWMSSALPGPAVLDPRHSHRLRDWVVPLRDGVRVFELRGTLDWVPPPTPTLWWTGAMVMAAFAVLARRARTTALPALAVLAAGTSVGFAAARQLDAGTTGAGALLVGTITGQPSTVLAGAGAVAAAILLIVRRSAADFVLAVAGAALVLFVGLPNIGVFTQAVAPAAGPSWWPRLAVLIAVGVGAGLSAAGLMQLRAAASSYPTRTPSSWKLPPPEVPPPEVPAPGAAEVP